MQNLSQPFPQNQCTLRTRRNKKTSKQRKQRKGEKAVCIIGGESGALGFHQKIQERRNDHQQEDHNGFCIKILRYFLPVQD